MKDIDMDERGLEQRLLDVLKEKTAKEGLRYSDLGKACRDRWLKSLAKALKLKQTKAGATHVKDFVYALWLRGSVFVEPPRGRHQVPRVWSIDHAHRHFPHFRISSASEPQAHTADDVRILKEAYDLLVSEHVGGYVPVHKLRREVKWSRDRFDRVIFDLNMRQNPVIELHGGDPQNYSESQKRDSIVKEGRLYLRLRWR